jgi:hypothetical protein
MGCEGGVPWGGCTLARSHMSGWRFHEGGGARNIEIVRCGERDANADALRNHGRMHACPRCTLLALLLALQRTSNSPSGSSSFCCMRLSRIWSQTSAHALACASSMIVITSFGMSGSTQDSRIIPPTACSTLSSCAEESSSLPALISPPRARNGLKRLLMDALWLRLSLAFRVPTPSGSRSERLLDALGAAIALARPGVAVWRRKCAVFTRNLSLALTVGNMVKKKRKKDRSQNMSFPYLVLFLRADDHDRALVHVCSGPYSAVAIHILS